MQISEKERKYINLLPQLKALVEDESDLIAAMANFCSELHQAFGFWWTGFYRVMDHDYLVLGPFQGPIACTRIKRGKGVCGTAWQQQQTIVVADVEQFPGHIACSSASRSEIVIPLFNQHKQVLGVLDIDSKELSKFDNIDKDFLEQAVMVFSKFNL